MEIATHAFFGCHVAAAPGSVMCQRRLPLLVRQSEVIKPIFWIAAMTSSVWPV